MPASAERLLGRPLVLALDVDGGEHAAVGHAGEQVKPGHAGAGADLDDGARAGGRGQHPQRRPAAGADRGRSPARGRARAPP